MTDRGAIAGVILAGGGARRFGGGDKSLAELDGQSLLSHVIARLRPQVGPLVLNANGDPQRFASYGLPVVPDDAYPNCGPLSGVLAALNWLCADAPRVTTLATVSADTPFLPDDLVSRLDAARPSGSAIAVSNGRRHPTIALYPLAISDAVAEALAEGALSVDAFASRVEAVEVPFPMREIGVREVDPFFNVNTRDDLEQARAIIRGT